MTSRIHKYVLRTPHFEIEIPQTSVFLSAGEQDGELVIWLQVSPARPERRVYYALNTGNEVPHGATYGATVVMKKSGIVWHIYEDRP